MNDFQPFSHQQGFTIGIGNTIDFLEPQHAQIIENAEKNRKTGLDVDSSVIGIIESTQETSQGDMAEALQGQSPTTNPVHPHKMCPFAAFNIQGFQQHPGVIVPQNPVISQYDRNFSEESKEGEKHQDFFFCGATNYKTLNTIEQETGFKISVFPDKSASLDQSCKTVPLKRLKTDSSSNSMFNYSTDEEDEEYENERAKKRNPDSIRRTDFSVERIAKFQQAYDFLEKLQSIEEFESLEKEYKNKEDFSFSADLDISEERQKKMKTEIRKAVIDAGLHGVLELFKHPQKGFEFCEAIQTKDWFQGVIQRKMWFESIFKDQKWYQKAKARNELLDCNHPHDYSSYDESVREECLAMRNLYALLYGMFKHGINANGQERFEPDNQGKLYQVIGNKRFSPADDTKQMGKEEFCKKVASSTLAVLFEKESQFFETYAKEFYESGHNKNTNSTTLTDSEKRQMLIAGKSYIIKRLLNPKKYMRSTKGTPPTN